MATGVYKTTKKDGSVYYRVSFTYRNKHISLGSSDNESHASDMYREAVNIINSPKKHFVNSELKSSSYKTTMKLSLDKYICLINFRDNNMYIKTPIYLCKKHFLYFLSEKTVLEFSTDDLFYYSNHTIQCRGGYYFISDYGMQTSILSRYGIHAHSVVGRDYNFKNGDCHDFRYENIQVINPYFGVCQIEKNGRILYQSRIHINGDFILGNFVTEDEAAIAYNKAVDCLKKISGTDYPTNYIESVSPREYASIYTDIQLSKKFMEYVHRHC